MRMRWCGLRSEASVAAVYDAIRATIMDFMLKIEPQMRIGGRGSLGSCPLSPTDFPTAHFGMWLRTTHLVGVKTESRREQERAGTPP